ncbi:MAG: hypothetical protein KKD28_05495 [Chloroflexi bacterium]|nr:hypothetical protein [Chloroflexota bacterium]MBU1660910.1 hypothetical protein [Chloroflexota bacterium]
MIEVTDSGIWIPPDKVEHIFDQCYQVEDHMIRHFGELGLGLAIARAMAELHGGRIWAQSGGPGKGTTLMVTLPRLESA